MRTKFIMAACQMNISDNKDKNIEKACTMIENAAKKGAELIALPEMFNCPYDNSLFSTYAEDSKRSTTLKNISNAALSHGVYVVAGTIPENDSDIIYNTSFIFDRKGKIIGKHRKIHLFDIDIPGKIYFKESSTLSPGNEITIIDTDLCKIGIGICYDIRFPELSRIMALGGAQLVIMPGAFNMTTGPAHWELLIRARAVDNQVYFAGISPARNEKLKYISYGNSIISDPWGNTIARAGSDEEILFAEINLEEVNRIREELPLLKHRRKDIY